MSKKRLRECPALGKGITPGECGECRISKYACPESCAFNPYSPANYEEALDLDDAFIRALFDRGNDDPVTSEQLKRCGRMRAGHELSFTAAMDTAFFRHRDEAGLTFADRWEGSGLKGLRNDHRTLFAGRRNPRISLLEIQEVGEAGRIVFVDLLDEPQERRLLMDKAFGTRVCRFECYLGITYRMPHYTRANVAALPFVEVIERGPWDVLAELVAHLGGRLDQDWLYENIARVQAAMEATKRERERIMLMETDCVSASVEYALSGSLGAMESRLLTAGWLRDEISEEEERDGFDRSYLAPIAPGTDPMAESMGGQPYCGSVALKRDKARLSATCEEDLDDLRSRLELIGSGNLRFERELVRDLAKARAVEIPESVQGLVPPSLLEGAGPVRMMSSRVEDIDNPAARANAARNFLQNYYQSLLDKELPLLGGLTPRAAASSEEQRPKLLSWAKGLVRSADRQNLRTGDGVAVDWVVRELGLTEIDSPAPPKRAVLKPFKEFEPAFDIDGDDDFGGDFSADEAISEDALYYEDRIDERMGDFEDPMEAVAAMEASGCRLVEEIVDEMGERLGPKALSVLLVPLVLAWFALFDDDEQVVLLPGMVRRAVREARVQFCERAVGLTPERCLEELEKICIKPGLALVLWDRLRNLREGLPKNGQISDGEYGELMIATLAAVNVLVEAGDSETNFGI